MTNLVSIITPVANYHSDLLPRCAASVEAQTIPATHIVVHDVEGRGAGWTRNKGLRQIDTPFVTFLDADDLIEPDFIEECLQAYDEKRYLYTDWVQNDEYVPAPDCAWKGQAWHCITTLLPTVWAQHVGGFDETLPAGEDTYFYMKLTRGGMCGKRVAKPLFHYSAEGRRSLGFPNSAPYYALMQRLQDEFGGKTMACCGDNPQTPDQPVNQQQPGQVLAKAIYGGNRRVYGMKSHELYPRAGNGSLLWVFPEDAHAAPHMFQIVRPTVPTPPPAAPRLPVLPPLRPPVVEPEIPTLNGAAEVAAYVNENSAEPTATPQALPVAAEVGEGSPNVQRVVNKARRAGKKQV